MNYVYISAHYKLLDYRMENMFFTLELIQETSDKNKTQVQNLKACSSHVNSNI